MSIAIRKSAERGHASHGWLEAKHSFSFAAYYDAEHMGFRSLRVINEDRVAPGKGFGAHPHKDMEIITYIVSGTLEHKDSMGHTKQISAGELQYISAGSGISHSEYNASKDLPVHLYQIWILPLQAGLEPRYDELSFDASEKTDLLKLVASPDGTHGSMQIRQDARLFVSTLSAGASAEYKLAEGRAAWLQVVSGDLTLNGTTLSAGDGAAIEAESNLAINAKSTSDFLLFDLE